MDRGLSVDEAVPHDLEEVRTPGFALSPRKRDLVYTSRCVRVILAPGPC